MNVIIVGLGSIGKRHVKVLRHLASDIKIHDLLNVDIDFVKDNQINVLENFNQGISTKPEFVIISNPTSKHVNTALAFAKQKVNLFIEKPLSHNLENILKLTRVIKNINLSVTVGFQMRFHPLLKIIYDLIKKGKIGELLAFNGYVGQYLPDWRPKQDYRNTSSAKKQLGGGVLMDISHELDIAISIMGKVKNTISNMSNISDLEINTEDSVNVLLNHDKSITNISLNYFDRKYTWESKIIGTKGTLNWDYVNGTLEFVDKGGSIKKWKNPKNFTRNDLFIRQLDHWFSVLQGEKMPIVSIENALYLNQVISAIKESSINHKSIEIQ